MITSKESFGKYLEIQADFGQSKKTVFVEVRERIEMGMAGWVKQLLSQAGKEVIIKAVAMEMPNHAVACFKLPIKACKDIKKLIRNYWRRGNENKNEVHWVS